MHRSGRHCFWLRLAVIAAAAAFVKADAQSAYSPATHQATCGSSDEPSPAAANEEAAEHASQDPKRDSNRPSDKDRTGSGPGFFALRPEVQDLNGASIRRLCPREPVSGLHQPVIVGQAMGLSPSSFDVERPAEPDFIRMVARPIVRHGPPNA